MTGLDDLPDVESFLGIDLRTGSLIVAAIGIATGKVPQVMDVSKIWVMIGLMTSIMGRIMLRLIPSLLTAFECHPMAFGCSFFMPMSYLMVTIWILVALYFAASVVLFWGLAKDDALLCSIWIWYALIFVVVMLMMMILLSLIFTSKKQKKRVFMVILGMLWYILTIYFILIVNSHRKQLVINEE